MLISVDFPVPDMPVSNIRFTGQGYTLTIQSTRRMLAPMIFPGWIWRSRTAATAMLLCLTVLLSGCGLSLTTRALFFGAANSVSGDYVSRSALQHVHILAAASQTISIEEHTTVSGGSVDMSLNEPSFLVGPAVWRRDISHTDTGQTYEIVAPVSGPYDFFINLWNFTGHIDLSWHVH